MGQYFDNEKLTSNIFEFDVNILGEKFMFKTDNGVFSKRGLDFGTRLLLESLEVSDLTNKGLDVGCGYGVISIIISKVAGVAMDGVDVNKRALHLATSNIKLNNVEKVNFFESNCYDNVEGKYDFIITNPPIRAGKEVLHKILIGAKDYLNKGGSLYFVMRKEQGAKSMLKELENHYDIEIITKKKGFYIFKCFFR